jgi:hypothetical protein
MLVARVLAGLVGTALAAACVLAAPEARADEPEPMVRFDPEAMPPPPAKTNVLIWGVATTAISYGGAVGASYLWESDPGAADLRIPVVGPWMKVGNTRLCDDEEPSCNDVFQVLGAVLAGFDGVIQVGGLALIAEGLFSPTRSSQPPASARLAGGPFASLLRTEVGSVSFAPVPFFRGGSDAGIAVVGSF